MKMHRVIDTIALLFVSVGAMIGSGWLFGPLYVAKISGAYGILSWILGGFLVMIVALTFAELAAMIPVTGGIARFPLFSHGGLVSFVMTWIAWLAYVMLPPIEIQALVQYAANYWPSLVHPRTHSLTWMGLALSALLLVVLSLLNILGIRFVTRLNKLMVYFKLLVPAFTAIVLIYVGFHASNFTIKQSVIASPLKSILHSLSAAGVIFSFFGFRLSVELGGEARNPQSSLPLSLLGSLAICIVLYTLVQFAFIAAVEPQLLQNGWANLTFVGESGPFVAIAAGLGLIWLTIIIFADAAISPFGSALMVVTTNARINYAMSKNNFAPKIFTKLNSRHVPYIAILINLFLGMLMLLPFPGWQQLASFIIAALVISHAVAPVSLITLRRQLPEQYRPFKLPYSGLICRAAFVILTLIAYWTGWEVIWKMYLGLIAGLVFLICYAGLTKLSLKTLNIPQSIWMFIYFAGFFLISYLGDKDFGGLGYLAFGWDFAIILVFSLVIFEIAIRSPIPKHDTIYHIEKEQEITTAYGEAIEEIS